MGLLKKDTFVCIDCEMTGLDAENDRIIEVAAISFTFDSNQKNFESLVDPKHEISEESIAIHHITPDMIAGKPSLKEILPEFFEIIGDLPIVGHGVGFDIDMLARGAEREGIESSIRNNPVIDTLRLARLYGESDKNSLVALRQHFNICDEGAHRAMSDVQVNIEVFKHLVRSFNTTEEVLKRLKRPIAMKKMPLGKHKGRPFNEVPLPYLRWAAQADFDQDLLYSVRSELKRRKSGDGFSQKGNPFQGL